MSQNNLNEKAPINWTNMVLFSTTPLMAILFVPLYGYLYGYETFEWIVFLCMMIFCGISITAGYHRLWSHKTYNAHPLLRLIFALGGACALQNDILHWASDHRRHHQFVDNNEKDPYSAKRGFWFSHIGWILRNYKSGEEDLSNVKDLLQDAIVVFQHNHYLKLVLLTNVGLPSLLGLINGNVIGCLLLGGLLRLVLSQHSTYLINSAAHIWGRQPYSNSTSARDNSFLALLTYGEGYHNYHHTFQWDYRNGNKWWHYDPTKWLICLFSILGITKNLKTCSSAKSEIVQIEKQYMEAASTCQQLNVSETWQKRLEDEYHQFLTTLRVWSEHRQAFFRRKKFATLSKLEKFELRKENKELKRELKIQRRRWEKMIENLRGPALTAL